MYLKTADFLTPAGRMQVLLEAAEALEELGFERLDFAVWREHPDASFEGDIWDGDGAAAAFEGRGLELELLIFADRAVARKIAGRGVDAVLEIRGGAPVDSFYTLFLVDRGAVWRLAEGLASVLGRRAPLETYDGFAEMPLRAALSGMWIERRGMWAPLWLSGYAAVAEEVYRMMPKRIRRTLGFKAAEEAAEAVMRRVEGEFWPTDGGILILPPVRLRALVRKAAEAVPDSGSWRSRVEAFKKALEEA